MGAPRSRVAHTVQRALVGAKMDAISRRHDRCARARTHGVVWGGCVVHPFSSYTSDVLGSVRGANRWFCFNHTISSSKKQPTPPKPPTERGVCKYNFPPSLLLVSLGLSGELAALLHADKPVSRDSDSEVLLINRIPPSRVQIVLSLCALSTTSTRRRTCKRLQGGAPSSRAVHYRTDSGTFIDGNGFRARLNTNAMILHTHTETDP